MPTIQPSNITDENEHSAKVAQTGNLSTQITFDTLNNSYHQSISAASGGTQLADMEIGLLKLRNASGNGVMFIGGVQDHAPYSGRGWELWSEDTLPGHTPFELNISNANKIRVCSTVSGQMIYYIGFGNGSPVIIPSSTQGSYPDSTPPTILATIPTSGTTAVPWNSTLLVSFSEPILSGSVDTTSFRISNSGSQSTFKSGSANVSIGSGRMWGVMTPRSGQLNFSNQWFNAYLTPAIKDVPGNPLAATGFFSFQVNTAAPGADVTAPTIQSQTPLSGTTGVDVSTNVVATMSEDCQTPFYPISDIIVLQDPSLATVAGTESFNASDLQTFTFDPSSSLTSAALYTVNMSGAKDLAGNFMVPKSWTFTTADPPLNNVYSVADNANKAFSTSLSRAGIFRNTSASALDDLVILKGAFSLLRTGNPTGNVQVVIRKGSNDSIAATLGTMAASSVSTSKTQYSFVNLNNTYHLTTDDKILVESTGSSAGNAITFYYRSTNSFDLGNTDYVEYDGTYTDDTGKDMGGDLYTA
jgi:hypothetical protein